MVHLFITINLMLSIARGTMVFRLPAPVNRTFLKKKTIYENPQIIK